MSQSGKFPWRDSGKGMTFLYFRLYLCGELIEEDLPQPPPCPVDQGLRLMFEPDEDPFAHMGKTRAGIQPQIDQKQVLQRPGRAVGR